MVLEFYEELSVYRYSMALWRTSLELGVFLPRSVINLTNGSGSGSSRDRLWIGRRDLRGRWTGNEIMIVPVDVDICFKLARTLYWKDSAPF